MRRLEKAREISQCGAIVATDMVTYNRLGALVFVVYYKARPRGGVCVL